MTMRSKRDLQAGSILEERDDLLPPGFVQTLHVGVARFTAGLETRYYPFQDITEWDPRLTDPSDVLLNERRLHFFPFQDRFPGNHFIDNGELRTEMQVDEQGSLYYHTQHHASLFLAALNLSYQMDRPPSN